MRMTTELLNTAVSFPISFQKGILYGAEGKISLPDWRGLSGYVSYSYIVGNAWFPVSGGLFVGEDATNAMTQLSGHFPDSQDQRNTARARFRYQLASRVWVGAGGEYGSGLPFDFVGTYSQALAEYGQAVVDRINFTRDRIKPMLSVDATASVDLRKSERVKVRCSAGGRREPQQSPESDRFRGLFRATPSRRPAVTPCACKRISKGYRGDRKSSGSRFPSGCRRPRRSSISANRML